VIGGTAGGAPRFDFVVVDATRFGFDVITMLSGLRPAAPSASAPVNPGVGLLVPTPASSLPPLKLLARIRFLAQPEAFPTPSCRFRVFFGGVVCFHIVLLAKYFGQHFGLLFNF
jgi:hypothetical protein